MISKRAQLFIIEHLPMVFMSVLRWQHCLPDIRIWHRPVTCFCKSWTIIKCVLAYVLVCVHSHRIVKAKYFILTGKEIIGAAAQRNGSSTNLWTWSTNAWTWSTKDLDLKHKVFGLEALRYRINPKKKYGYERHSMGLKQKDMEWSMYGSTYMK